jgi:hypothetical protein
MPKTTPEVAQFIQALMQTDKTDLDAMTMVRQAERKKEREEKLAALSGKLKSRKA